MYKRRNEVERLFRRLKGFRHIFSRFDKLDVIFTAFIQFALIVNVCGLYEQALVDVHLNVSLGEATTPCS